jgi:hypothetical protein
MYKGVQEIKIEKIQEDEDSKRQETRQDKDFFSFHIKSQDRNQTQKERTRRIQWNGPALCIV